jgi:hypothetical protein
MKPASQFSLLVFAPVYIAFLLPALFLLPSGVLFTLLAFVDSTVPLSGAASYDMWIMGPVAAAICLFLAGRWLHHLFLRRRSLRTAWLVIWAVSSAALFAGIWIGLSVLTSVGASDMPGALFVTWTASMAAGLTLLAQALVIPWLYAVSRMLPRTPEPG